MYITPQDLPGIEAFDLNRKVQTSFEVSAPHQFNTYSDCYDQEIYKATCSSLSVSGELCSRKVRILPTQRM